MIELPRIARSTTVAAACAMARTFPEGHLSRLVDEEVLHALSELGTATRATRFLEHVGAAVRQRGQSLLVPSSLENRAPKPSAISSGL